MKARADLEGGQDKKETRDSFENADEVGEESNEENIDQEGSMGSQKTKPHSKLGRKAKSPTQEDQEGSWSDSNDEDSDGEDDWGKGKRQSGKEGEEGSGEEGENDSSGEGQYINLVEEISTELEL